MLSDTFQMTLDYEDAIIKVPSKNRPKDDLNNVDIGCGNAFGGGDGEEEQAPAGGEGVEMVLDVVANSELKQVNMSKKEFMAYIKDYFKKIIAYLEGNGKKEDSDTKIGDKFLVENTQLTQKVKPQKEKKSQKVSSPTPKKIKKKVHFSNSKDVEKDTDKEKEKEKEKILQQKNNQIKQKLPQTQIQEI